MLSIVVAVSSNNVIGINNSLPWHIPEDLKHFKEITTSMSKTIIMGRKTFESLPFVLPNRRHIVLTKNENYIINDKNVTILNNLDYIKTLANDKNEYFIIGGAKIYKELLPYCSKIYRTVIHKSFVGDAFFPHININRWKTIYKHDKCFNNLTFSFELLQKINI